MHPYEIMYILDPQTDEETMDSLIERFEKIVTDAGGEVEKTDRIGKRRLAYEIEKKGEGFYVVMQFQSGKGAIDEIQRVMNLTDAVMRHLLVRRDEE